MPCVLAGTYAWQSSPTIPIPRQLAEGSQVIAPEVALPPCVLRHPLFRSAGNFNCR
jgi:hypothetical protein